MKPNNLSDSYGVTRIWELDFIRGFCIILMIFDHTLYDLAYVFRYQWFGSEEAEGFLYGLTKLAGDGYFQWIVRDAVWWGAVFCFIFICGISCSFSHSNLKRGLRLAAVALLLSLATYGMDIYFGVENVYAIRFGILHMLAASILLYCLLKRSGSAFMLILSIAAVAAGIYFLNYPLDSGSSFVAVLIYSRADFHSADYFPLLPWFGFFIAGAALGPLLYPGRRSFCKGSGGVSEPRMKPVLFIGRHSLVFYVLHQPIVYGLLTIVGMLV
ncbi:hypothetical protein MASR2M70_05200 [Bacillota bacterium]